jgi:hypothetical protein
VSISGAREAKYDWLLTHGLHDASRSTLTPGPPYYHFVPLTGTAGQEWYSGMGLHEVFAGGRRAGRALPFNGAALATRHDEFAIAFSRQELAAHLQLFFSSRRSDRELREHFRFCTSAHFDMPRARRDVTYDEALKSVRRILYRPFDWRWVVYHPLLIGEPRPDVMRHLLRENLALLSTRRVTGRPYDNVFVTNGLVEYKAATHDRNTQVFPLFLYDESDGEEQLALVSARGRRPNLSEDAMQWYRATSGERGSAAELATGVFYYLYALLHSPIYRRRYATELSIDYARMLMTSDRTLLKTLREIGSLLTRLHIMEGVVERDDVRFFGAPGVEIDKVSWDDGRVLVAAAGSAGFTGISREVWDAHIGGYRICEKWLKDRKGRPLDAASVLHYRRIVTAMHGTIRAMPTVDLAIERAGGWSVAFGKTNVLYDTSAVPLRRVAEPTETDGA